MPDRRPSGGLRHSLSRQTSCCPGPGQAVRRAGCPHPACPRPRALLARALRPPGPGPRFSSKLGGGLLATGSPLPPSPVSALPRAADESEHPEGLTWSEEGTGGGGEAVSPTCVWRLRVLATHVSPGSRTELLFAGHGSCRAVSPGAQRGWAGGGGTAPRPRRPHQGPRSLLQEHSLAPVSSPSTPQLPVVQTSQSLHRRWLLLILPENVCGHESASHIRQLSYLCK